MKLTKKRKQITEENKEMMGIFKANCGDVKNFTLEQRKGWQKMAKLLKKINTHLLFFDVPEVKPSENKEQATSRACLEEYRRKEKGRWCF